MYRQYLKYISALILFGSNGIVASYIALNSYEIVFTRTFIGSIFLTILFLITKQKIHFFQNKLSTFFLILSGIAMGTSWLFLYEAYHTIGVSIATLAYYCGPVIVMILSPIFFGESITFSKIIGFFSVLLGMVLVNGTQFLSEGFSWGLICSILSAIFYALMIICNKKAKNFSGLENTICQLIVSCIVVTIFLFLVQPQGFSIPKESIFAILFLGIVNTGIGYYLYFSSIQHLSAQSVSICSYIDPFSALIFSAILLDETLSTLQIIGAICILCGAAFGELYKKTNK